MHTIPGTALRLDELVPAEPVKDLIQVPDVQPAPLVSDGLLEAPLQFVTVRGLAGQQRQDCVMQRMVRIGLPSGYL